MKALLHQPFYDTFESRPDLKRPSEVLPRQPQGRTLSWQITLSYPSPPMSSPPSPQKKHTDIQPTTSIVSVVDIATTNTVATSAERVAVGLPSIIATASATAPPSTQPLGSLFESATFAIPTASRLTRASTSSNEGQGALVRTDSASSASAIVDVQPTAGPSTATVSTGIGRGGRRLKTHVANACNNCKRAHLSCDVERPCNRCTQTGKADTCRDVPHKKRGRPRLRDEGDFRIMQPEPTGPDVGSTDPGPSTGRAMIGSRHRRTGSLRTLRSYPDVSGPHEPMAAPQSALGPAFAPQIRAPRLARGLVTPTAFLDLDFTFLKTNAAFHNLMGASDLRGVRLTDVATPQEGDSFRNTRNALRAERETKEPAYLPPIIQPGVNPVHGISVTDQDIDEVTRGFDDQHYTWTFRLSAGERTLPVKVRLAKTSVYFVTLFLPPLQEARVEQAPSLPAQSPQQLYHAPPIPIPQPIFQGSPTRQFLESQFQGRENTMIQTSPPSPFYRPQGLQDQARAPHPGPAAQPLSRSYPPFEMQPRLYPQPPPQQHYQQQPSYHVFQPTYPPAPLHTIQERPPVTSNGPLSAGALQSPFIPMSPFPQQQQQQQQSFTSTRPRSETMESLGRHVQTRLRADSGVTASSAVIQSSPPQQYGTQRSRESSRESGDSGAQRPSPRKRRRMNLDEVLHQR